jgi:hypothetical protein
MESERPDAHFRDPYARRLAGAQGEEIVHKLPHAKASAWAMVVRTCVFDEFIERAVARNGVDTVLNLAAGLDARPYRVKLPASLCWIEVDLPPMLSSKEQVLAGERPACRLERVKMDLGDVEARRALFARVGGAARQVLVHHRGAAHLFDRTAGGVARRRSPRALQFSLMDRRGYFAAALETAAQDVGPSAHGRQRPHAVRP